MTDGWPAVAATRDQADVALLGTSRTYCDVMPMEMWRTRGVTALDVTGPIQTMPITLGYLQQVLASQHPKVVMVDLYMIGLHDSMTVQTEHTNLDVMPFGLPKMRAIVATAKPGNWFELAVPLQLYHSRWSQLLRGDFQLDKDSAYAYARGAAYWTRVQKISPTPAEEARPEDGYLKDLSDIREMAQTCKDRGIRLVLFTAPNPHRLAISGTPVLDRLRRDLSAEFPSVDYLDMNAGGLAAGISTDTDYMDEIHLNHRGAVKLSKALADLLVSKYGIGEHRGDAFAGDWNAALAEYDKAFSGVVP